MVAITPESLSVVPKFPFNLMFLPEICGLERTIPVRAISNASRLNGTGVGNNVLVAFGGSELRLKVRNPEAFVAALASMAVPTAR
jgi:hypothetical protein